MRARSACFTTLMVTLNVIPFVRPAVLDQRMMNPEDEVFSVYDVKNKRPFCNAFQGCVGKRADPLVDEEAAKMGARMIMGMEDGWGPASVQNGPRFGSSRLRLEQFGFFPGYLNLK